MTVCRLCRFFVEKNFIEENFSKTSQSAACADYSLKKTFLRYLHLRFGEIEKLNILETTTSIFSRWVMFKERQLIVGKDSNCAIRSILLQTIFCCQWRIPALRYDSHFFAVQGTSLNNRDFRKRSWTLLCP